MSCARSSRDPSYGSYHQKAVVDSTFYRTSSGVECPCFGRISCSPGVSTDPLSDTPSVSFPIHTAHICNRSGRAGLRVRQNGPAELANTIMGPVSRIDWMRLFAFDRRGQYHLGHLVQSRVDTEESKEGRCLPRRVACFVWDLGYIEGNELVDGFFCGAICRCLFKVFSLSTLIANMYVTSDRTFPFRVFPNAALIH